MSRNNLDTISTICRIVNRLILLFKDFKKLQDEKEKKKK